MDFIVLMNFLLFLYIELYAAIKSLRSQLLDRIHEFPFFFFILTLVKVSMSSIFIEF